MVMASAKYNLLIGGKNFAKNQTKHRLFRSSSRISIYVNDELLETIKQNQQIELELPN